MLAAGVTLSMDLLEQSRGGQRTRPDIRGAAGSDSPDSPISRDSRPSQSPSLDRPPVGRDPIVQAKRRAHPMAENGALSIDTRRSPWVKFRHQRRPIYGE